MKPKISIICPVFNAREFVEDTIRTVIAQTYGSWELLVMDGGSRDGTVAILERYEKQYPNIRCYSEPDEGSWQAAWRGLDRAEGEFICFMYASDGYLNNNWFKECGEALDADPALSLVWGIPFDMREDGKILGPHFAYAHYLRVKKAAYVFRTYGDLIKRLSPKKVWQAIKSKEYYKISSAASMAHAGTPPQKDQWFFYWLRTGITFPDANMVVSKKVFIDCAPRYAPGNAVVDAFHDFFFNFNSRGYLSRCIPVPANYARIHGAQTERRHGEIMKNRGNYFKQISEFKKQLKDKKEFSFIDKNKKKVFSVALHHMGP